MTNVGKILVFINLLFSLLVGGLVMMVYMTRTNWEDAYTQKESQLKAVVADRDQFYTEALQKKTEKDNLVKSWEDGLRVRATRGGKFDQVEFDKLKAMGGEEVLKQLANQVGKLEDEKLALETQVAAFKSRDRSAASDNDTSQAVTNARTKQVKELQDTVEVLRDDKQKLIVEKNEERQKRIRAEVDAKVFEVRAVDLEGQNRELMKDLVRAKNPSAGALTARKATAENPPENQVEGRITFVDPKSDYLKISIGSDAGLKAGHTLKAYRLSPVARYLGTLEVVSVTPKEAVVRPLKKSAFPLELDDRVASSISVSQ